MMMPFVRLLAIYALVGAAIFAFLKRDQLIEYFSEPESGMVAEAATDTQPEPAPAAQPQAQAAAPAPARGNNGKGNGAQRAFGSEISPQYFGLAAAPTQNQPAAPTSEGDLIARWTEARGAYSQGNTADASRLYEALTVDFPQNADLHGEVGNLYYNLGQFGNAAEHYYAVAEIAFHAGDVNMVNSMYGLLQRISPSKATELQALLSAGR